MYFGYFLQNFQLALRSQQHAVFRGVSEKFDKDNPLQYVFFDVLLCHHLYNL